ncbi:MAG: TIGR02757 family protein, partial [Bacteroidota bacterium]
RTFNGHDCMFLIRALKNMYAKHGGPEAVFTQAYLRHKDIKESISAFRSVLLDVPHDRRSEKHISNAAKDSACKRINLYLRWMVRNDNRGVDFGLWKGIPASALYLPLDLHTGNTSRELGLLSIKQNNWKAVAELTENLRKFDANDPVKYDYALFGLGVYDKLGG